MITHWMIIFVLRTGVVQLKDAKPAPIQVVNLGDSVTIQCHLPQKRITTMVWYKQSVGQNPRPLAMVYNYVRETKFEDEFQNGRFNVYPEKGSFHLNIAAVGQEDTGAYYCGIVFLNELQFVSWTFLMPAGIVTKTRNFVQQPVLELVHAGHSISLECTVFTKTCSEDHSVYWFRHAAGESHPGIIFTHGDSSSQCTRSSETVSPTQSCIYKLPKNNLSLSDAGTYYCAVAACGEILFGNGTALKLMDTESDVWDRIVFAFAFTNALTVTVIIALVFDLWNNRRKRRKGSTNNLTDQHQQTLSSVVYSEDLNYAAMNFTPNHSASRKARRTACEDKSVYSEVSSNPKD
ncbi:polymeric immunoglobulin receptor-like [Astyanax mexicanus]|uniref:polymeric immunoglobulin receptor-like n=1 Tax=Astyanax mexicanus TaxID=7994 RepID=UPI0020CB578B|nr:polymeric immunoglobulin receptor-like [Astyanax mexicanus]